VEHLHGCAATSCSAACSTHQSLQPVSLVQLEQDVPSHLLAELVKHLSLIYRQQQLWGQAGSNGSSKLLRCACRAIEHNKRHQLTSAVPRHLGTSPGLVIDPQQSSGDKKPFACSNKQVKKVSPRSSKGSNKTAGPAGAMQELHVCLACLLFTHLQASRDTGTGPTAAAFLY